MRGLGRVALVLVPVGLAVAPLSITGCVDPRPFQCATRADCNRNGQVGTCEPTQACAYPDPSCPDGRRYSGSAGADLAGQCVGSGDASLGDATLDDARRPDAQLLDAADASTCIPLPSTGVLAIDGALTSASSLWARPTSCATTTPPPPMVRQQIFVLCNPGAARSFHFATETRDEDPTRTMGDSMIVIYRGGQVPTNVEQYAACDDDGAAGYGSVVSTFAVASGETITLVATQYSMSGTSVPGTYRLRIMPTDVPTVSFTAPTSTSPESVSAVNLQVAVSPPSSQTVMISYSVLPTVSTYTLATLGTDFALADGTLTFTPGQGPRQIPLSVSGDSLFEVPESVRVYLRSPVGAPIGKYSAHRYTIQDDDPLPTVSFASAASSGGEATTTVLIPVIITPLAGRSTSVSFTVSGTATAPADHSLANGTLVFAAGESSKNISVTVVNDAVADPNETIVVTLTPTGASLTVGTPNVFTYTIVDND